MALHGKPVVLAVEIARIASDDHVVLRDLHRIESLRERILLVVNNALGRNRHRIDFAAFHFFVLVKLGLLRHGKDFVFAVVFQVIAREQVRIRRVAGVHIV